MVVASMRYPAHRRQVMCSLIPCIFTTFYEGKKGVWESMSKNHKVKKGLEGKDC